MKDTSGASMMDPETQVTRLFGVSVLDAATRPYEDNLILSLIREYPDDNGRALANVALNAFVNLHGTPMLAAAYAARQAGNSPNTVLCSALGILGPGMVEGAREAVHALLGLLQAGRGADPSDAGFDFIAQLQAVDEAALQALTTTQPDRWRR